MKTETELCLIRSTIDELKRGVERLVHLGTVFFNINYDEKRWEIYRLTKRMLDTLTKLCLVYCSRLPKEVDYFAQDLNSLNDFIDESIIIKEMERCGRVNRDPLRLCHLNNRMLSLKDDLHDDLNYIEEVIIYSPLCQSIINTHCLECLNSQLR